MIIKVENTAISNGVSKSIRDHMEYIKGEILDYGAGKLRNAKYLAENGYSVSVTDIPEQMKKWEKEDLHIFKEVLHIEEISKKYDTVLLTFVLNVIPNKEEREKILKHIHSILENTGNIIIEVRRGKGIMNSKHIQPHNDGYILGKGKVKTFQKPFSEEELIDLVSTYFNIIRVKKESDSIILIGGK